MGTVAKVQARGARLRLLVGAIVLGLLGATIVGLFIHQLKDHEEGMEWLAAMMYGAPIGGLVGVVCGAWVVRVAITRSAPRNIE
jgi:ABC-type xylose transport system permease subunit